MGMRQFLSNCCWEFFFMTEDMSVQCFLVCTKDLVVYLLFIVGVLMLQGLHPQSLRSTIAKTFTGAA